MKVFGAIRATVAVAAGAGLVWGATQATDTADATRPADVRQVAADSTSSTLSDVSLSCTGAETAGHVQVASAPAAWLAARATSGSVSLTGKDARRLDLVRGAATDGALPAGAASSVVGKGGLATGLVATQTQLDDRVTARGLAVSPCGSPVQDGWYFGGGDAPGRIARLTLVNTGATASTVNATVVGADGVDSDATVKGTVLAPGERKTLVLGDFGKSLASAAVHVTATGAGVSASLTDSWLDGEIPVGEDTTSSPVIPAKKLDIPAVSATGAAPEVRVAVPGKDEGIVRVRAVSPSGDVVFDKVSTVAAGASEAVRLTGLTAGGYDVQVTGDVPVVAAAMSRTASSGTTDLAWSPAVEATKGPAGIALPTGIPGRSTSLMLTAPTRTKADIVTVTASGAETKTVGIPADRPVVVGVKGAVAVWVRPAPGGALHAAVTIGGSRDNAGLLATVPLQQTPLSQSTKRLVAARG
ncbi:MAG TPA: DUF5719 family protein [Flexivirga sp.]|uniref:DUF5719 family protein n=1 Tax=Flexivirga sp. TaxID=1962927 RepID=UPI002B6AAFB9|nr:DUF5719 family protein [Flexivirga sp.]HWC23311.1 DUF5719 family protein [Flexivirga sp.]